MNFSTFRLEKASYHQAQAISDLINQTYRGKVGWTTEAAIIQGDRTDRLEIETAMRHSDAFFFVAYQSFMLVSCIYVAKEKEHAYIGFFSVHPSLQQQGFGKYMLEYAEAFAYNIMQVRKFSMFVVSQRPELIAFYQRRGYRLTGQVEAYPSHLGIPKASNLTIDYLEKVM
ncbi:MAG: GNAT family N-acetyltransferase [Nitrosomonas sp.]|nr:GNAT family N-acetyltransferase [Nitrosomonas sp.]